MVKYAKFVRSGNILPWKNNIDINRMQILKLEIFTEIYSVTKPFSQNINFWNVRHDHILVPSNLFHKIVDVTLYPVAVKVTSTILREMKTNQFTKVQTTLNPKPQIPWVSLDIWQLFLLTYWHRSKTQNNDYLVAFINNMMHIWVAFTDIIKEKQNPFPYIKTYHIAYKILSRTQRNFSSQTCPNAQTTLYEIKSKISKFKKPHLICEIRYKNCIFSHVELTTQPRRNNICPQTQQKKNEFSKKNILNRANGTQERKRFTKSYRRIIKKFSPTFLRVHGRKMHT